MKWEQANNCSFHSHTIFIHYKCKSLSYFISCLRHKLMQLIWVYWCPWSTVKMVGNRYLRISTLNCFWWITISNIHADVISHHPSCEFQFNQMYAHLSDESLNIVLSLSLKTSLTKSMSHSMLCFSFDCPCNHLFISATLSCLCVFT